MKKLLIIVIILLTITAFSPARENSRSPIQLLEARIETLEARIETLETKSDVQSMELSNLESIVNFILSDSYVDWLLSQLGNC